jgi:glycosyltransferase involved in cell wall biosynthesis
VPRVSVIVPAYNSSATIGAAIESVLDGAYEDLELVICDDASTDATAVLVEAHPDPRVRLVRSQTNGGPAAARNLALEASSGELVAFLDADDRWLPEFLTEQVALYDRERPAGIVTCDAWLVDERGERVGRHSDVVGSAVGAGLTEMLAANRVFISALCPREVIDQAGGFSTECFGSEDHDLWLRILERGHRLVYNPEPLALYAVAVSGISSSAGQMARTEQATYRRALDRNHLTASQRRIARAKLALAESAGQRAAGRPAAGAASLLRAATASPRVVADALKARRRRP